MPQERPARRCSNAHEFYVHNRKRQPPFPIHWRVYWYPITLPALPEAMQKKVPAPESSRHHRQQRRSFQQKKPPAPAIRLFHPSVFIKREPDVSRETSGSYYIDIGNDYYLLTGIENS